MKKQLEVINQWNKQNERCKFYKAVNNMRNFQPRMSGCKGKDGKIVWEEKKIPERRTEHFVECRKKKRTKSVIEGTLTPTTQLDRVPEQTQGTCQEPTWYVVERTIQRMKYNRAPGEDTIVAELIIMEGKK
jgi:hypothetical protein